MSIARPPEEAHSRLAARPWWREPMMWLVVGGPALVVVAGIATTAIALARPDPVVVQDAYRRGLELSRPPGSAQALRPALAARNHAATAGHPAGEAP